MSERHDNDISKIRKAHRIVVNAGGVLTREQINFLRSMLPPLPKQKKLEEITDHVYDVWAGTNGNDWPDDIHGELETWLDELHTQLQGLKNTPSPAPALPEGMRLADHKVRGRCVVSPKTDEDGDFLVFTTDKRCETGAHYLWLHPEHLTFIDPEPGHPEFLETEADYAAAPEGTIVAMEKIATAWVKKSALWGSTDGSRRANDYQLRSDRRRVLRWGWGE